MNRENLGFVFDVGHANTNDNVDQFLEIKDKIIHVHVHDNHGERDEHLPIDWGTVNWEKVIGALNGYTGRFITESRSLIEGEKSVRKLKLYRDRC